MENNIVNQLTNRGRISFMELRALFPIDTRFRPSYNNLMRLGLIEETLEKDETLVNLTEDGMAAGVKGLQNWTSQKVLDEIKRGEFVMTKELTSLEVNATRTMEQEGVIYQSGRFRFKISPSVNKNITSVSENNPKDASSKTIPHLSWRTLLGFFGWIMATSIAVLSIIEYKFGYVAQAWEWFLYKF